MITQWLKKNKKMAVKYCYRPNEVTQEDSFDDPGLNVVIVSLSPQQDVQFSLGTDIIFNRLRHRAGIFVDMAVHLKSEVRGMLGKAPVPALYSQHPVRDFDIVGLSLYYVGSFFNAIPFLRSAKIKLLAVNRLDDQGPLVIAGGGAITSNPEPLAELFDIIVIGDGETPVDWITENWQKVKSGKISKKAFLKRADKLDYLYVPMLKTDQTVKHIHCEDSIDDSVLTHNDFIAKSQNKVLEIIRGCYYKCNFCQLSFLKSKAVPASPERVVEAIKTYPKGASVYPFAPDECSYKHYDKILANIGDRMLYRYNQRINSFAKSGTSRQSLNDYRVAFGLDGVSQRVRDVLKKQITLEEIETAFRKAFMNFDVIKCNMVIAFPFETPEDWDEFDEWLLHILEMRREVSPDKTLTVQEAIDAKEYYQGGGKKNLKELYGKEKFIMFHIAPTPFTPEPHTPMEYMGIGDVEYASRRLMAIQKKALADYGMVKVQGLNSRQNIQTSTAIKHSGRELLNVFYNIGAVNGKCNEQGISGMYEVFFRTARKLKIDLRKCYADKDPKWQAPYRFIQTGNESLKDRRRSQMIKTIKGWNGERKKRKRSS